MRPARDMEPAAAPPGEWSVEGFKGIGMAESTMRRMANVNGEITLLEEARISILDRGFLYGDSVYEVFRTYDGVPLFCDEHFERMDNSARLIHMKISQSREEMLDEMRRTAAAANIPKGTDIYIAGM